MADVLVVEDDADTRSLLRRWIARRGHSVVEAPSGERALELLPKRRWGLIVLDMDLPGIDGGEVAQRMRAGGLSDATVLVCTVSDPDDHASSLSAHWLEKPFTRDQLTAALDRALEERRA